MWNTEDCFFIRSWNVLRDVGLTLFNSDGRIITNQEIPTFTKVSATDYLPGIYFYKIFDDSGMIKSGKLVVTPARFPSQ